MSGEYLHSPTTVPCVIPSPSSSKNILECELVSSQVPVETPQSPPGAFSGSGESTPAPQPLTGVRVAPKGLLQKPRLPLVRLEFGEYLTPPPDILMPFSVLVHEAVQPQPAITRAIAHYLNQYKSFKPVAIGDSFSYEAGCFVSLAQDIIKANGNVHQCAFDTQAVHYDWLRVTATKFVRRLFHPDTCLPSFTPGNLAAFDGSLDGITVEEFPSGLLSVEALYCTFFLDNALPYYVYLYAMDIQGAGENLTSAEAAFIAEFDYYSFVAAITYLGSLLLSAAEGFSRILYEGVRWMLLRAYCCLGILEWPIVKATASADIPDYSGSAFLNKLSPADRFDPRDTSGDSYAQYGWELFRTRSNALFYLASITQISFFNTYHYDSGSKFFELQTICLKAGYVLYKPTRLARKISEERYRKKDLKRFCTDERTSRRVFYFVPIENGNTPDVAHELYILLDILGATDKGSFVLQYARQKAKIEEAQRLGMNVVPPSLEFPLPAQFGIGRFRTRPIIGMDLSAYLLARYSITFNPFILCDIPRAIYHAIYNEEANAPTPIAQLLERYSRLNTSYEISVEINAEEKEDVVSRKIIQQEAHRELYDLRAQIEDALLSLFATTFLHKLKLESYRTVTITDEDRAALASSPGSLNEREVYFTVEDICNMAKVIRETYSNPFEVKKTSKVKNIEKLEATRFLPRPRVKYPDAMFFALKTLPSGAETMIVVSSRGILYAGFSGILEGVISKTLENDPYVKNKVHKYKVYRYTFVPLVLVCTHKPFVHNLGVYIDMSALSDISDKLQKEYPQTDLFSMACQMQMSPSWMGLYSGAVNIQCYFDICSRLRMGSVVLEDLSSIYSIPVPFSIPTLTAEDYERIRTSGRVLNYTPRFTDANDTIIRRLVSPDMTKMNKKFLLDNCVGHTWDAIEARARKIAKKMLIEERVFNINLLPVRNYTAKTKELLERNFQAALNVDPRLKVDDNKRTEAALRKKYLTPRPRRPL